MVRALAFASFLRLDPGALHRCCHQSLIAAVDHLSQDHLSSGHLSQESRRKAPRSETSRGRVPSTAPTSCVTGVRVASGYPTTCTRISHFFSGAELAPRQTRDKAPPGWRLRVARDPMRKNTESALSPYCKRTYTESRLGLLENYLTTL